VQTLVFTKTFGRAGVPYMADALAGVAAGAVAPVGVDLLVREGETAVGPDDPGGVMAAVRCFESAGLGVGQVTTDVVEAGRLADGVLGACAEVGVPLLRTGFYGYDAGVGYPSLLADARRRLGGLAERAAAHGVTLVVPLHHGTIHPSGALTAALVDGLDGVGVLVDPGNQAHEGSEDHRLTLDLVGDRLACVGVKNAGWRRRRYGRDSAGGQDGVDGPDGVGGEDCFDERDGVGGWVCEWTPLADGVVRWAGVLGELRGRGYLGPCTLHVFYPCADPQAAIARDLGHLQRMLIA
jgi:sugar phosphate isomerase/epimerase